MPSNYDDQGQYLDDDLKYGRLIGNVLNPPAEGMEGGTMVASAAPPPRPVAVPPARPAAPPPAITATPTPAPAALTPGAVSTSGTTRPSRLSDKLRNYFDQSTQGQFDALDKSRAALDSLNSSPTASTTNAPLEKQRADLAQPLDPSQAQYKPGIGTRILRGVRGAVGGLLEGGPLGAVINALPKDNPAAHVGTDYQAPNRQWNMDTARRAQQVAGLDAQMSQNISDENADTNRGKELSGAQKGVATGYNDIGKTVTEQVKAEQASPDLRKYQIITSDDGSIYRIDPDNPSSAEPITGPGGQPIKGKGESGKVVQLEIGGTPHSVMVDGQGNVLKDLGRTGEKPPTVNVNAGTYGLEEDGQGNPVLLNNKTGEVSPAGGVFKSGTKSKADAATLKANEPLDAAQTFANDYLSNKSYTGAGDEALLEKYFELAKPSTGFRMSQPQIDLLKNAQSWLGTADAKIRHATSGTWFSNDQRKEIVDTMNQLASAKKKVLANSSGGSRSAPAKPKGVPDGAVWNPQGNNGKGSWQLQSK